MPIKIRETEKEGHRKFRTQEPKRYRGLKSDLYGTKTHKKKPYHDKTTLHKSQRHPHSRLKTQKEYKTITDSSAYKKADYHTQNKMLKKHPTTMKAGGSVTRFRSSGPEGKPHSTKEGRSAEAQRAYMRQHGPQEPRRKRIWPKRAAKATGGRPSLQGIKDLQRKLTPPGKRRQAGPSAARPVPKSLRDRLKDLTKKGRPSPGRPGGKGKESPDKRWNKGDKFMTPLRAKKAKGGRIGLKKGSVHTPGSHSWWLMNQSKPKRTKKAEGGRIGYQHGGRTRLLEELGRVEAEPSNRNRRAEISRVHRELNRGYKSGGAVLKGKKVGVQIK